MWLWLITMDHQMVKKLIWLIWLWSPWTTRWWGGRGRDHRPPVHSCQRLWSVGHYIEKKWSVRHYVGGVKNLLHYAATVKSWRTRTNFKFKLKAENLLMINSKQHPQRSAAAIASLRAVLTRPGFNGAITCDGDHSYWLFASLHNIFLGNVLILFLFSCFTFLASSQRKRTRRM